MVLLPPAEPQSSPSVLGAGASPGQDSVSGLRTATHLAGMGDPARGARALSQQPPGGSKISRHPEALQAILGAAGKFTVAEPSPELIRPQTRVFQGLKGLNPSANYIR